MTPRIFLGADACSNHHPRSTLRTLATDGAAENVRATA
jgi:hypothetical protein